MIVAAGCVLLLMGVLGKIGAAFATIPTPVIGGMFLVMFGVITAVGISNLQVSREPMGKQQQCASCREPSGIEMNRTGLGPARRRGSLVSETTLALNGRKKWLAASKLLNSKAEQFELDYPNHSDPKVRWESGLGSSSESVCCSESSLPTNLWWHRKRRDIWRGADGCVEEALTAPGRRAGLSPAVRGHELIQEHLCLWLLHLLWACHPQLGEQEPREGPDR